MIDIAAREKVVVHAAEVYRMAEHTTPHGYDPTCPPTCAKNIARAALVQSVDDLRQARAIANMGPPATIEHARPGCSESR